VSVSMTAPSQVDWAAPSQRRAHRTPAGSSMARWPTNREYREPREH
jgi:hypothetical protein